jgi:hypothetical protein|tara:strand:+ start:379 stop:486 length:108 start_codon:yes stop_codon:yes gene_type:complete
MSSEKQGGSGLTVTSETEDAYEVDGVNFGEMHENI